MTKSNSCPDNKPYHMYGKINHDGRVSALCFAKPRAIDLKRALWTFDPESVTCRKCLAKLAKQMEIE